VQNNHLGQDTPSELADLVIISLITQNRKILLKKTALIQCKKETAKESCAIQQNQLNLLHNFPSFIGVRGLEKQTFKNPVNCFNITSSLCQYCSLKEPGDLLLTTFRSVALNQINNRVSANDTFSSDPKQIHSPYSMSFPLAFIDHPDWGMLLYEFNGHLDADGFSRRDYDLVGPPKPDQNCKV